MSATAMTTYTFEVILEWHIKPNNPTQGHSKEHLSQKTDPENKTTNIKLSCWNSIDRKFIIFRCNHSKYWEDTTEVHEKLVIFKIKHEDLSIMERYCSESLLSTWSLNTFWFGKGNVYLREYSSFLSSCLSFVLYFYSSEVGSLSNTLCNYYLVYFLDIV